MATLAESLKPTLHSARSVAGSLGFRPFRVYLVKDVWSGSEAGFGTRTETLTEIKHDNGQPVKVHFMKGQEVLLNECAQGAVRIGPITPGLGLTYDTAISRGDGETAHIKITGPGMGTNGTYFSIKEVDQEKALRLLIVAEPTTQS